MKDLNTFYTELKAAGALTAGFAKAAKENTIAEFLKTNDVAATAEEFAALAESEMTEQQLEAVAGGANISEAYVSIFTVGIVCAMLAIQSAVGSGNGNGSDGQILCNDL